MICIAMPLGMSHIHGVSGTEEKLDLNFGSFIRLFSFQTNLLIDSNLGFCDRIMI